MEGFIEVNEISDFVSYIRSIEWRDPWLIALLSFHVLVTFTCLSTRNYGNFQIILFITLFIGDVLCMYAFLNVSIVFMVCRGGGRLFQHFVALYLKLPRNANKQYAM